MNTLGIKLLQEFLEENALDAFLVLTKVNRQYVSGFTGSAGVVVITPSLSPPIRKANRGRKSGGGAELYVDDRYLIRAKRESGLKVLPLDKLTMTPLSSPLMRGERGGSKSLRVGIEDRITLREFAKLKKDYKNIKWVVTRDVVENLRAVKTAQEIGYIKKAQGIIDQVFKGIVRLLKSTPSHFSPLSRGRGRGGGITESDVALEMERLAKKFGADGMAFEPIVAWGPNAAAPHHLSGKQKIKKNNFLLLDFGVLVNGYHSDFTRTLFIGRKPSKKQEKVYNTVLEAQRRVIAKITPTQSPPHEGEKQEGVKASVIDHTARDYIARKGFGKYFTHNTGHGVGLEIHELPNFSPQSEDILCENMIVTVEPGIYIEGWGGVRIEDMVLVGSQGPIVLSKSPKDLKSAVVS